MAGMSVYLEQALLNEVFRTAAYTKPTRLYVSLHAADPTDAGTSSTEITGNGYARADAGAPADSAWTLANAPGGDGRQVTNASQIAFPTPTGNWVSGSGGTTVTHFGIWDAATGGNLLFSGSLGTSRAVVNGDGPPTFQASSILIRLA